ncbi:trypco2 family protein [Kribbella sp. NPDC006257]|uniref:trypco2 family protein n=1 Tax=Kribbella sp. NPDC006257 TaxID=3156738 RepID=UPI0033A1566A
MRLRPRQTVADLEGSLFLKELLARVQRELRESQQERQERGEGAIFEVERLTLEVNFVAQVDREIQGGLDLQIVTAGGSASYQNQQIHKIVLELVGVGQADPDDETLLDLETAPRFRPRED